jgi:hypothetical protein
MRWLIALVSVLDLDNGCSFRRVNLAMVRLEPKEACLAAPNVSTEYLQPKTTLC